MELFQLDNVLGLASICHKNKLNYHSAASSVFLGVFSLLNFLTELKGEGWQAAVVLGSFTKPKIGAKCSVTFNVKILEVQDSFCSSFKQCSFVPSVQKQNK